MPLTSELFKDNQALQDCHRFDSAHLVANEPPLRRGVNDSGPHIALIHRALRKVMPGSSFGLEEATETYGPKTAEVVRQFKARQTPPILNKALGQTVPDNIIGIQTIGALDKQVKLVKPIPPPAVPPPLPPNTDSQRLLAKRTFEDKFVEKAARDLSPASGDAGFAIGTAINQGIIDIARMNRNPIESADFDDGKVVSTQLGLIPQAQIMKRVDITKQVVQLPSRPSFGIIVLRFQITRSYQYSYGLGQRTDRVTISTTTTIKSPGLSPQVFRESRTSNQPSSLTDPR